MALKRMQIMNFYDDEVIMKVHCTVLLEMHSTILDWSSNSLAFKDTCTKTARFCFFLKMGIYYMVNDLWSILRLNLTDTEN